VYLNSIHTYGPVQEQLALLSDALKQSLDKHWRYQCSQCGYSTKSFFWACPSCHEWSSIRYEGS
jgi:lipopolysaccharide biosynthesis regulator YciM